MVGPHHPIAADHQEEVLFGNAEFAQDLVLGNGVVFAVATPAAQALGCRRPAVGLAMVRLIGLVGDMAIDP